MAACNNMHCLQMATTGQVVVTVEVSLKILTVARNALETAKRSKSTQYFSHDSDALVTKGN